MVGVALPSIQADLGLTTSQLQWVVSAYVLGLGGLLLLGGRAADLLGRRRVLIARGVPSLGSSTLASLIGGLVDDGTLLIAARFLKGAGRAFTVPAALSLITTTFTEGPARNKALAIFNAFGASGFSLRARLRRPADRARLALDLPAPRAGRALLLFAIPRYIARDRAVPRRQAPLRPPAARSLLTAGMLLLVRTIVEAPHHRLGRAETIAGFVALDRPARRVRRGRAAHAAAARAARHLPLRAAGAGEPRRDVPVRRLRRLPVRGHAYLQKTLGWSALETALAFLPGGLLSPSARRGWAP